MDRDAVPPVVLDFALSAWAAGVAGEAVVQLVSLDVPPEVGVACEHRPLDLAPLVVEPRPYEYTLQQALSEQEALEQQIVDAKRHIAAQGSAVEAARAAMDRSGTGVKTAMTGVDAAKAAVTRAKSAVTNAEAGKRAAILEYDGGWPRPGDDAAGTRQT